LPNLAGPKDWTGACRRGRRSPGYAPLPYLARPTDCFDNGPATRPTRRPRRISKRRDRGQVRSERPKEAEPATRCYTLCPLRSPTDDPTIPLPIYRRNYFLPTQPTPTLPLPHIRNTLDPDPWSDPLPFSPSASTLNPSVHRDLSPSFPLVLPRFAPYSVRRERRYFCLQNLMHHPAYRPQTP